MPFPRSSCDFSFLFFFFHPQMNAVFHSNIQEGIRHYYDDLDFKNILDFVQEKVWVGGVATLFFIEAATLLFPIFLEFMPIPRAPFSIYLEYFDVSCLFCSVSHCAALEQGFAVSFSALQIASSAPRHGVNCTRIFIFPDINGKQVPKAWKLFDNYPNLLRWNKICAKASSRLQRPLDKHLR